MHRRKGQTIIEAIVAITTLTTGFLGIVSLLSRSFYLNRVIADETKATFLASEGIELAKNLIDHDVYLGLSAPGAGGGWGACFPIPIGGTNDYELDYTSTKCPPAQFIGVGRTLRFNSATGRYGYDEPDETNFTRRIRITIVSAVEIKVLSVVTWSTGAFSSRNIELEDHFFNWHP